MKTWTKEEEEYLIKNVSELSVLEMAKALNKTEGMIRGKKSLLKLKSGKRNLNTNEEINSIINWYNNHPNALNLDELSKIINKTKMEICRVASRLNLTNINRTTITDDIINERKEDIVILCNKIKNEEHRLVISKDDIDNCDFTMSYNTYNRIFHEQLNMSISDYIYSIGFKFLKAGNGMVYHYDDGEITSSQFEYIFTNYLRNINLKFNSDYNRSVRYNTFINDYKGMMDCDYVITYKDRLIYVEIAGMLKDYQNSYYRDKPIINSKSKEEYRQKLMKKEDMFKESGVEYYILFPSDLNDETYRKIFD